MSLRSDYGVAELPPDAYVEAVLEATAPFRIGCVSIQMKGDADVSALQLLPPGQRSVLMLRDVLDFPASEAAQILESPEESVTSTTRPGRFRADVHPCVLHSSHK